MTVKTKGFLLYRGTEKLINDLRHGSWVIAEDFGNEGTPTSRLIDNLKKIKEVVERLVTITDAYLSKNYTNKGNSLIKYIKRVHEYNESITQLNRDDIIGILKCDVHLNNMTVLKDTVVKRDRVGNWFTIGFHNFNNNELSIILDKEKYRNSITMYEN